MVDETINNTIKKLTRLIDSPHSKLYYQQSTGATLVNNTKPTALARLQARERLINGQWAKPKR